MQKLLTALLISGIVTAYAGSVSVRQTGNENSSFILENALVKAVLSPGGGTLLQLTDKKSGKRIVDGDGALRDQFPPVNGDFAKAEYTGRIIKNTPAEAVVEFSSPALDGRNQFTLITKTYRLKADEAVINVNVKIHNQLESMADKVYEYWCNSFFGIPTENNDIFVPLASGIHRERAGSNRFYSEPVRGFVAMLSDKSRCGTALLVEYRKFKLAYSWNSINHTIKRNTLEFRNIPEKVSPGSSLAVNYAVGIISQLDAIHGAGVDGCGKLNNDGGKISAEIYGFRNFTGFAVLKCDGRQTHKMPLTLTAGKSVSLNFPGKLQGNELILEIVGKDGKTAFDLLLALSGKANFKAREKRISPPVDKDPWHFKVSSDHQTEHFKWSNSAGKIKTLALVAAIGTRDVVELGQRIALDYEVPTIFPSNWAMSWREKVNFAPGSAGGGGITAVDTVLPFLNKKFDLIILGSSMNTVQVNNIPMRASSWSAYPAGVRKKILEQVRNGAGLLWLNPDHADAEMSKILSSLKPADEQFTLSMSFQSAPYFDRAKIKCGSFGKGRIITVTYPVNCFLAPLLAHRHRNFQHLQQDHRYWEYQFAILSRLARYTSGKELNIRKFAAANGKLAVTVSNPGEYKFSCFDRYSQQYGNFSAQLKAGTNEIVMPLLRNGRNFIHITAADSDFAFTEIRHSTPVQIKKINMKTTFSGNEAISGSIELSAPQGDLVLQSTVSDNTGRLLATAGGEKFNFKQLPVVTNRHILTASLIDKKGRITAQLKKEFFLPETFDVTKQFTNMCWLGADMFPEYTYAERLEQLRKFGFNYLYGGMFGDASPLFLRYANVEAGMNWYGAGTGLHLKYNKIQNSLKKYNQTRNKLDLIRQPCLNDPAVKVNLPPREKEFAPFASRKLFQLGDEMSITYYQMPIDYCFCKYCLTLFRKFVQQNFKDIAALNRAWDTKYKSFDEVIPQSFNDTIFSNNHASFVAHRLFMDKLFRDTLVRYRSQLRKKYPGALAGPTGVANSPHPYGGNWNFYMMKDLDCASYYGIPRIQTSFNREKRFVMSYRGYSNPANEVINSFWEGLFAGERNTNNWFCPVFLLPDLRHSQVRDYYKKLLWELRSGAGDLLFHAKKQTDQAAILHSQTSLISNFLKQKKLDYFKKGLSFAKALEDIGIAYRFIAPEELSSGILQQNFKVLILPEATALSDKEIAAIRSFAAAGNKVIADYDCALQYDNCVKRPGAALDKLFGIKSGRLSIRKVSSHTLAGITINNAIRGIKLDGGRALGEAKLNMGKAPLAIVNGNTLYLNFEPLYEQKREKAFRKLLDDFIKLPSPGRFYSEHPVMHSFFTDGKARYIGLLAAPQYPNWINSKPADAAKHPVKGEFKLPEKFHLYNVRQGKYLGYGKVFKMSLLQGDGTLLAALPYKVAAIEINAPAVITPGISAKIEASVKADGGKRPDKHVLLLQVFSPDGSEKLTYRKIVPAENGKAVFTFPAALNDHGKWRLLVKDAASGITAQKSVEVK